MRLPILYSTTRKPMAKILLTILPLSLFLSSPTASQSTYGSGTSGTSGVPIIGTTNGRPTLTNLTHQLTLTSARPSTIAALLADFNPKIHNPPYLPNTNFNVGLGFFGLQQFFPLLSFGFYPVPVDSQGKTVFPTGFLFPYLFPVVAATGTTYCFQWVVLDPQAADGLATTQGLAITLEGAPYFRCDAFTLLLFHFDEGQGQFSSDSCRRVGPGKLQNATWATGVQRNAIRFKGGGSRVIVPDPLDRSTPTTGQITVEAWVYIDKKNLLNGTREVIRRDQGVCQEDYNLRFQINQSSIRLDFRYNLTGCTSNNVAGGDVSNLLSNTPNWYHIVGQYDGRDMKVLIGTRTRPLQLVNSQTWRNIGRPRLNKKEIYIGQGSGQGFLGIVDEVRISSIARY